jgi:CheY-like chemotaxis protein
MDSRQTQFLKDPLKSVRPNKFNVAIIYETAADGIRAKLFSDQVIAKVADGRGLAINLNVWSFKVLGIPEILYLASISAATADLVIISVTDTKTLPWQFRDWIATWSSLVNGRHPFLVALFANPADGCAPVHDELRRVAAREGIRFYTRTDHGGDGIHRREKSPAARLVESGGTPMPPADDRVLVVDDDHYSIVLAGKMLQILGYHADFASDGTEAVESFLPGKYSAILMDVTMPVMDGLDATEKIREIEVVAGGRVPIIAMTANVMPGDRERCLAAGMDAFLSKPFHKTDLAEKLDWTKRYCLRGMDHKSVCYLEETV